jgi:hypothetical protein
VEDESEHIKITVKHICVDCGGTGEGKVEGNICAVCACEFPVVEEEISPTELTQLLRPAE